MECSVCRNSSRRNYCDVCGNNTQEQVDLSAPGLAQLTRAYSALMEPDYQRALTDFQQALRFKEQLPRNLLMVAFFEYGLTIVRAAGGGPLKRLTTSQLVELTDALNDARRIYETLPTRVTAELGNKDYLGNIRFNLDEAKRVLEGRGSPQASNAMPSPAAASGSGCFSIVCIGGVMTLLLPLVLFSSG